jgi:4-hydroxy-tetrahydrodipicolinate synthase
MAAEEFVDLAVAHPNLRFVKVETQPPGRFISDLQAKAAGRIEALVGYAGVQMPDALSRGAIGVQPGCSFGEIYVELYRRYITGDLQGFQALHARLLPYINYWMQTVELVIQAEKTILQRRGLITTDYCRAPRYRLDAAEQSMIDRFLDEFGEYLAVA